MTIRRPSSGNHKAASVQGESEVDALWRALEKQERIIAELDKATNENRTQIAVLQLKASLWTIIGAFIATAMWFIKEIVGGQLRGR